MESEMESVLFPDIQPVSVLFEGKKQGGCEWGCVGIIVLLVKVKEGRGLTDVYSK